MTAVRIVVFAKAPMAGFAKTRLIPALGAAGAARVAGRMIEHTLAQALCADIGPVELCATPARTHSAWQLTELPAQVHCTEQGQGDLGERLASAARRVLGGKHPALDAGRMREAAQSLREHDAVMIPATDGGYVLLGTRRFEEDVFQGIAWSTSALAWQTLDKFAKLGWRCESLAALSDIDEPENLELLPAEWCEVRCG